MATPFFTTNLEEDNENNTILPPLPEVKVERPEGSPPEFDGTVATGAEEGATSFSQMKLMANTPTQRVLSEEWIKYVKTPYPS